MGRIEYLEITLQPTRHKYDIPANSLLRYCLRRVEILNAVSPDVYLVKSWYFYQRGEYKKALEIIDQGIRLNPKYAHLWINRGIYALANNDGDALVDFDKALSLYPGYPHRKKILAMQGLAEKLIAQRVSIN
jgi:tetratricopeptide (TPR) repeat protein